MSDDPMPAESSGPVPERVGSKDEKHLSRSSWLLEPDIDLGILTIRELLLRRRLRRLAARPADAPIRSRQAFHCDQRKKVCEMAIANPSMSHQELADHFATNKTTITRTLKQKKKWLQSTQFDDIKAARDRRPSHAIVEFNLKDWFEECAKDDVIVTDAMIKEKAMSIARSWYLVADDTSASKPFACSTKWMKDIKSRYGLVNGRFTDYSAARSRRRDKALGHVAPKPPLAELPDVDYHRSHSTVHAPATEPHTGESLDALHPLDTSLVFLRHDDAPLLATSPRSDLAQAGIDPAQSPAQSHDPETPSGELVHSSTSHAGPSMSLQSLPNSLSPSWPSVLESTSLAGQVSQLDWTQVDPQSNAPLLSDADMSLLSYALTTSDLTGLPGLETSITLALDIAAVPASPEPEASGSGIQVDTETLSTDMSADEMFLRFMLGSSPPSFPMFPMDPSSSFSMDHTTTFTPEAWANPPTGSFATELPYSQWPAPDFLTGSGSASEEALQMTTAAMCDGQTDFDASIFSSWPDVSELTGDMCTPLPFELTEM